MANYYFRDVAHFDKHLLDMAHDDIGRFECIQDTLHTSFNPQEVRQAAYEMLLAHYTKLTLRAREQYRVQQQERAAQADADAQELRRRAVNAGVAPPLDTTLQPRKRAYYSIFGGPIYLDEYETRILEQHSNFDFEARTLQPGETLKIAGAYSPPARYKTEYQYAKCMCGAEYVSFTQDEVKVWISDHLAYVAERAYFDSLWDLEDEGSAFGQVDPVDARVEVPLPVYGVVLKHYACGESATVTIDPNPATMRFSQMRRAHVAGEALAAGDLVSIGRDGRLYKANAPAPPRVPSAPAKGVAEAIRGVVSQW